MVTTYLDSSARDDRLSGGIRRILVTTPCGTFRVWTRRFGNNPRIKLLLLHGGPGCTHEYFEPCDSYLPEAGVEFYYYDQLGSYYADQPDMPELWEIPRFVDEVEQVRVALGLEASNLFLLGHSGGGILALEYALRYQHHLKGLIISNMMASIPAYNEYAERVLMPTIDPAVLAEIKALEAAKDYQNPRYMELLMQHHYVHHILRVPLDAWPDSVERTFKHLNQRVYVPMQGPSELGASGKLASWDRSSDVVPTESVGQPGNGEEPARAVKPFGIAKRVVWEAYRHVKANRGAAGIDGESMQMFEANLKDNLYRVWNRMSSGSYCPPAIRLVEIPKKSGGVRTLGIFDGGRPDRSDGSQDLYRTGSGAVVSSRLLRIPPWEVCLAGHRGDPEEVLEIRLGHRVRHP
jgi:proline iminopeptidase